MTHKPIKVLLIEDNPGDARLIGETLAAAGQFQLECVDHLAAGLERLRRHPSDVVLLDLTLPDARGMDSITRLAREMPRLPVIALSGNHEREPIEDAVKKGAEDYLLKGGFSADLLVRSIRYAIDRRQAREELAEARDSALESARLRAEFLANMSHEIRTPLNGIVGITRLLTDTPLSSDQRDMLEIARHSADALLRIVNDVLDFSKIAAGKVSLEEIDLDLGATVERVLALFCEQAHSKGIELASYIDGDAPAWLRGDPARLAQVLTNLVGNAVKFTHQGEVTVRVGLVRETPEQVVLRFTIRDTGIGIPLDSQRYLFQAFAQADGSTTRKYGGTGLGLAISAQLIELMGGNIGVQSETGGGSTFWFTAGFGKQSAAISHYEAARFTGTRVLVVDPGTSAQLVREQAAAWGSHCDIAASGAAALAALRGAAAEGRPYEVALIDLQLPDMAGLKLGQAIKGEGALSRTRVLAMYSLGARPDQTEMRAAGIRGLLVKPIKQSQLFNSLSVGFAAAEQSTTGGVEAPRGRRKNLSEISSRLPADVRARTRILLVEDNAVNQKVQIRLLERLGYRADCADNGREALEKLGRKTYDVVLMDCQMPELDGYTATRELRRREAPPQHTTVIGVTAHALAGDREDCLAAGMDDYLSKPVAPEDLAAILEKWVIARNLPALDLDGNRWSEQKAERPSHMVLDPQVLTRMREDQQPGERDFVADLIAMFLADLARRLEAIREALLNGDAAVIREHAHALKGACGDLGAASMRRQCERLETQAAAGLDQCHLLIEELEHEAILVRNALEGAWRSSAEPAGWRRDAVD